MNFVRLTAAHVGILAMDLMSHNPVDPWVPYTAVPHTSTLQWLLAVSHLNHLEFRQSGLELSHRDLMPC